MPQDRAHELMKNALNAVLPSVETFARTAKSTPAKKKLMMQIEQIKEALAIAEQASMQARHQPGDHTSSR
jgi:LPS O-antigen subunit length determinant protein (WzzB/FepE family)